MIESTAGPTTLPAIPKVSLARWRGVVLLLGGTAITAGLGYWFGGSWPLAVIGGIVGFVAVSSYVQWARVHQVRQFAAQLPDVLLSLANSLNAGHSLSQAVEHVASRHKGFVGSELRIVSDRIALGDRPLQAMQHLANRFPCTEVEYVLLALSIHDTLGGDLAKTLESSAASISETLAMRAEVAANTAQARMSSYLVASIPLALIVFLNVVIPDYYADLLKSWIGDVVFAAIFLLVLSALAITRSINNSVENS